MQPKTQAKRAAARPAWRAKERSWRAPARDPEGEEPRGRTASDLEVIARLYEVGSRCARPGVDYQQCLETILDAAIFATGADKGNIQLWDAKRDALIIVAHRGFGGAFLDFFSGVHAESAAASRAAMRHGQRIVVEDVTQSELFAGQPSLDVLVREGVQAVQSTPLVSSTAKVLGMISTHFGQLGRLTQRELRFMDLLARQAADYLERKQIESALLAKEQQLERVTENVATLIAQCNRDLRYVFVNKACADFIGKPVELIEGRSIAEVLGEAALEAIRPYIDRVLEGERVEYETQIPYATAGPRHMHVVYVPDFNPRGGVRGWISTLRDITEQRLAEQELRTADRRKDEFLALLAHELRNPLAPLPHSLQVIKSTKSSVSMRREALDIVERQVTQLTRLVDDLFDVSRISQDRLELKREPTDLAMAVRKAIETVSPLVTHRGQKLTANFSSEPIHVSADSARLEQVFSNLLNNAAKYTDPMGSIAVTVEGGANEAIVFIRDNGRGIPAEMLGSVFDLFRRVDQSRARSNEGLGLGLMLVKRLVEMHGGTVEAHSEGTGHGSEFVVRLPVIAAPLQPQSQVSEPMKEHSIRRRILIVDDNRDALSSLAMLLEQSGHNVVTALDGETALEAADRFYPELTLLDIGLPEMDGYEVCRRMREKAFSRQMKVVALTGWGQEEDKRRSMDAGFDLHMVKPLNIDALEALIAGLPTQAA
jgi:PAS domain S-box-containing protein